MVDGMNKEVEKGKFGRALVSIILMAIAFILFTSGIFVYFAEQNGYTGEVSKYTVFWTNCCRNALFSDVYTVEII